MISDVTSPLAAISFGPTPPTTHKDRAEDDSRESNQGVSKPDEARDASGQMLSEDERRQVTELRARDQEVRTHEQAHVAAAGALFRGGPYYTYQAGPDGKRYAVGGSVKIDTSEGGTPEETIQKAAQIRAAALAPAEPSSADQAIAAKASQMQAAAQRELAEAESDDGDDDPANTVNATDGEIAGTSDALPDAAGAIGDRTEDGTSVAAGSDANQPLAPQRAEGFSIGAGLDTFA